MMSKEIYLDNAATTMVDPSVVNVMDKFCMRQYANASSSHTLGHSARDALEDARKRIAQSINASPSEIVFTSGGTESNNLAIKGIAFANRNRGNHIITTAVEHSSVLNTCKWLETQGFNVTYIPTDTEGFITADQLEKAITEKTILFTAVHGNNEIGTILDLKSLGDSCKKHKIYFHTDACQSYTKTDIDAQAQHLDLITLNAHKVHGPKGAGALYVRHKTALMPWQHGGGQEFGTRGGTENIPGIVGFAKAAEIAINKQNVKTMTAYRDRIIDELLKIPESRLNGAQGNKRLCNNVNISFKGIEADALVRYLDYENIAISTVSACSERSMEPSHVLRAIHVSKDYLNGTIRLSLSRFTTPEEIDITLSALAKTIQKLRKR